MIMTCSCAHRVLLYGFYLDDCREQGMGYIPERVYSKAGKIHVNMTDQFVVSGSQFNMNFLLLCMQSSVCVGSVMIVKKLGIISFRDFDSKDAKMWFPISCMLVGVIYTGSKSLVSTLLCESRLACS